MTPPAEAMRVTADDGASLAALLLRPARPVAGLVLAHGAGAGMAHPFLARLADELWARDVATLRFQFPYMENQRRRPDPPAVAHAAARSAVAAASARLPGVPVFAGGKSFGGRMTSQAHSAHALPGIQGLVFVGFPLHPAGKPSAQRAEHLLAVAVPMLFLQGTRDALADLTLVQQVTAKLGERATLCTFEDADHAFHVRAKSGTSDEAVLGQLADVAARWMKAISHGRPGAI